MSKSQTIVDVVPLRAMGAKRPREQVLAAWPVRGVLHMFQRTDLRTNRGIAVAALTAIDDAVHQRHLLPALDEARVVRWRGADLVVAGLAEERIRRDAIEYRQAWWVRLVCVQPVQCLDPGLGESDADRSSASTDST